MFGSKDSTGITAKLRAVCDDRALHYKPSRIGEGITAHDVRDYMAEQGVEKIEIE